MAVSSRELIARGLERAAHLVSRVRAVRVAVALGLIIAVFACLGMFKFNERVVRRRIEALRRERKVAP